MLSSINTLGIRNLSRVRTQFCRGSEPILYQRRHAPTSTLLTLRRRCFSAPAGDSTKKENKPTEEDEEFSTSSIVWTIALVIAFAVGCEYYSRDTPISEDECSVKLNADFQPGSFSQNEGRMKRVIQQQRLSFEDMAKAGVAHASMHGTIWTEGDGKYYQQPYWNDEAAYEFTPEAVATIRDTTHELHAMSLEAVDLVVESDELMDVFEIPPSLRPAIRDSWNARETDFIGRFDFIWDGTGPPKLLEYNADTPTILVEAAVGQDLWLSKVKGPECASDDSEQVWCFNSIQDKLVKGWPLVMQVSNQAGIARPNILHILHPNGVNSTDSSDSAVEEREHLAYIKHTAQLAGLTVNSINMSELESLVRHDPVINTGEQDGDLTTTPPIPLRVFKSYPYEWLVQESIAEKIFAPAVSSSSLSANAILEFSEKRHEVKFLEPPWKLLLGNKALLALLWEMYPNHSNLLYATYDEDDVLSSQMIERRFVAKPKYGREGVGVMYSDDYSSHTQFISDYSLQSSRDSLAQDVFLGEPVYQKFHPIRKFSGRYCVLGSWVIRGEAAGLCVREDCARTTKDNTSIVPHYVSGKPLDNVSYPLPILSVQQLKLREELYGPLLTATDSPSAGSGSGGSGGSGGGAGRGGSWWFFNSSRGDSSGGAASDKPNKNNTTHSEVRENIKKRAQGFRSRRGPGFGAGGAARGGKKANGAIGRAAARHSHSGRG